MRRLLTVGAGVVVVLGLLGPTAVAGDEDRDRDGKGSRFTLYATETAATTISATGEVDPPEDDPTGFTAGARFLAVDTLYSDSARTRRAGRNDISCEVVEVTGTAAAPSGATLLCSGVVRLDTRGSLAWQGSVTFAFTDEEPTGPFATVALTGGTDDFRRAGGQAVLFDESGDDEDAETLTRYEVQLTSRR